MNLYVSGDDVVFGQHRIPLDDFCHWWIIGNTEDSGKNAVVEGSTGKVVDASPAAVTLLASEVRAAQRLSSLSDELALDFFQAVIYWGNVARVWGIVLKGKREGRNIRSVSQSLNAALECIEAIEQSKEIIRNGRVVDPRVQCLREINQIHGLGSISFSSKIARFLAPSVFGVLDSLVAAVLEVDVRTTNDATRLKLARYSKLLEPIAQALNEREDKHIGKCVEGWLVADADLALWAFAKHGRGNQLSSPKSILSQGVPGLGKSVKTTQDIDLEVRIRRVKRSLTNHQKLEFAFENHKGEILRKDTMWQIVEEMWKEDFTKGSFLPNDHASGNKNPCWCAMNRKNRPLFENLDDGTYRIL